MGVELGFVVDVAVPGLPLIGNLHQLKAKRPHQTFAKWAEIYGPIYSIRLGSSTMVVLNSAELAKEVPFLAFYLPSWLAPLFMLHEGKKNQFQ